MLSPQTTSSTSIASDDRCKVWMKLAQRLNCEVVIRSGLEGSLMLNLEFHTSLASQLETIMTKLSTGLQAIWSLWSNLTQW